MKLVIDRKACLKSGQCTYAHPDLLREGADGYPEVLVSPVPGERMAEAEDAVEMCPAGAISLVDEGEGAAARG